MNVGASWVLWNVEDKIKLEFVSASFCPIEETEKLIMSNEDE
jgi:hypothetical protein